MAKHTITVEVEDWEIAEMIGEDTFTTLSIYRCIPELVRLVESAFNDAALVDEFNYHATFLEEEIERGNIPMVTTWHDAENALHIKFG